MNRTISTAIIITLILMGIVGMAINIGQQLCEKKITEIQNQR